MYLSSFPRPYTRKRKSTWLGCGEARRRSHESNGVSDIHAALGTLVGLDLYSDFATEARKRLNARDPDDWPILAAALALGCPIWTEDTDFFGCGVATWTSTSIDSFLAQ